MHKKNILSIYIQDLRKISTNWVAVVILTGLVLLPSLYAWINIKASWDPYGNTKGVKVGIVNEDKGSKLRGMPIDIGKGIVDSLKDNTKLGWTFYDNAEEGKEAVDKGKVYATIIIPDDFSYKMTTMLNEEPIKPKLEYYVNEKINAIAPKMTDSGVTTIQRQISTSFLETAVKKIFEVFNKVGIELNNNYPQIEEYKNKLFEIDSAFPTVYGKIDNLIGAAVDGKVKLDDKNKDVKDIQKVLGDTSEFMSDVSKNLVDVNDKISENSPKIKEDLALVQAILDNVSKTTGELGDNVIINKPQTINELNDAIGDISDLSVKMNDMANRIESTGKDTTTDLVKLSSSISGSLSKEGTLLKKLRDNVSTGKEDVNPLLADVKEINDNLAVQTDKMISLSDSVFTTTDKGLVSLMIILGQTRDILSGINTSNISGMNSKLDDVISQINNISGQIASESIKNICTQLVSMLNTLKDSSGNLDQMTKIKDQLMNIIDNLMGNKKTDSSITSIPEVREQVAAQHKYVYDSLNLMQKTCKDVSKLCDHTKTTIDVGTKDLTEDISGILPKIDNANTTLIYDLNKLAANTDSDSSSTAYELRKLQPKVAQLKEKLIKINDAVKSHNSLGVLLKDVSDLTFSMEVSAEKIRQNIDDILPRLQNYLKNYAVYALDIREVILDASNDMDVVNDLLDRIKKGDYISVNELNSIRGRLPKVQKDLDNITGKIKEFEKTSSLKDVINLMQKNGNVESDFISQPVELNTHKVFSVANYGAGMTPFYSTLSLWVGALLLTALLSTKVNNADFKATPKEEFFGKYLLFGTLGMLQGIVVCAGDILVLGVKAQEPILLICLGAFYSIIFTMIIYSLVALFGDVGKALGVVLLVVQLAGSGGTFPIEVTPIFFQRVYSALPFTYAIGGMREAVAGVVYDTLLKDISILIVYFVAFTIIGVSLKKWTNMLLTKLTHKLAESGVIGH